MRQVLLALLLSVTVLSCGSSPQRSRVPEFTNRDADVVLDDCPSGTYAGGAAALPDLTLPCLGGGHAVTLTGLTGLPTIVNIWASWCLPCQREVPALEAVHTATAGRLRILGIDMEDQSASALDFAKNARMSYPSVIDRDGDVLRRLGLAGAPSTVFLDASGAIVYRQAGQFKNEADLRAKVQRYLQVTP